MLASQPGTIDNLIEPLQGLMSGACDAVDRGPRLSDRRSPAPTAFDLQSGPSARATFSGLEQILINVAARNRRRSGVAHLDLTDRCNQNRLCILKGNADEQSSCSNT